MPPIKKIILPPKPPELGVQTLSTPPLPSTGWEESGTDNPHDSIMITPAHGRRERPFLHHGRIVSILEFITELGDLKSGGFQLPLFAAGATAWSGQSLPVLENKTATAAPRWLHPQLVAMGAQRASDVIQVAISLLF
jgi:hypothetical protein